MEEDVRIHHLKTLDECVMFDLEEKGYLVADMKPDHIIISEEDTERIEEMGRANIMDSAKDQINHLYNLINKGTYSVVDYELLLRTPEHEDVVKDSRRHSYLDDQRNRFVSTLLPEHLTNIEILGVPYICGHAESTGGHLWVVGNNARLFDYFLPERWRKTPSIRLSDKKEIYYTVTKDNIHLVWETSRVGEMPDEEEHYPGIRNSGINSPFEEFSIAQELTQSGIPCVYVRAIYMTGSTKIEASEDIRRYESHKNFLDPEDHPILQEDHNYITIRGYYNGPDDWVAEQTGSLHVPVDLSKAVNKGIIDKPQCRMLLEGVKNSLKDGDYNGSLLKPDDLLLSMESRGEIVKDNSGNPLAVICNFEHLWK